MKTYPVFVGYVESWPVSFPGERDEIVQLQLVDGFKMLSLATVSGDFPQQGSGARVQAILDAVNWLETADIEAGSATVPAITLTNASALDHIQQIAQAEGGRFFFARDGKATFRDRNAPASPDLGTRTWADDGTGMSYRDIVLDFSDTLIANDVRVTRTGGTEQVASNLDSQQKYGLRSLVLGDMQLLADGDALTLADLLLEAYREPRLRIESLVDNAMKHSLWDRVLGRELTDQVAVTESRTNSYQVSLIEGLSHDVTGDTWTVTLRLSPSTTNVAGILDDATYGLLDTTAILGT